MFVACFRCGGLLIFFIFMFDAIRYCLLPAPCSFYGCALQFGLVLCCLVLSCLGESVGRKTDKQNNRCVRSNMDGMCVFTSGESPQYPALLALRTSNPPTTATKTIPSHPLSAKPRPHEEEKNTPRASECGRARGGGGKAARKRTPCELRVDATMYCKYMHTKPTSTRRTHLPERLLPPFVVAEGGHDLNVGAVRLEPVEQQLALLALLHYPPGEGDNIPLM